MQLTRVQAINSPKAAILYRMPQQNKKMSKLKESCASVYSNCINICVLCVVFLCSNPTNVEGFDSGIELSRSWVDTGFMGVSRSVLYVNHFGAKGDGLTDDTKAFEEVWKTACSLPSLSKVVISARHSYLVRPINFAGPCKSEVTVKVCGTIVAPRDPGVWRDLDSTKWLYFHNVKDLTLEGGGIINGMGHEWWAQSCKINKKNKCGHAPTAITFNECQSLNVRDLKIVNSQQMHMTFSNCEQVVASHVTVLAPAVSPNTDGIHISASTDVKVKDSTIKTGDDCISIVSNSSRIRITNISCGPGHGISIGSLGKSGSWDQVHDVKVNGAILSNAQNGLRIKTWQGGRGYASEINFRNIWMENVHNPIIIDQYYCDSNEPCKNQTAAVKVTNVSFVGIRGTSASEEAIRFACSDSFPCEELFLEDIFLSSQFGGMIRSFCWEAHGSSLGLVYPPPCFALRDRSVNRNSQLLELDSPIKGALSFFMNKVQKIGGFLWKLL